MAAAAKSFSSFTKIYEGIRCSALGTCFSVLSSGVPKKVQGMV